MFDKKQIAKNTLFLYVRMFLILIVGLFTSRVVLATLGENDYGVYNVVGGVVTLFTVFTGSLSSAITRFITYELGKGDEDKLKLIFSSSVIIQAGIGIVIALAAETAGIWFISNKMTIDPERIRAATWVLHFSVITFVVNLISIPYNALIIAHERMSAFAYIGIFEALGKLAVAVAITFSVPDKLVTYSFLLCVVATLVRIIYGAYCKKHFPESRTRIRFDRTVLKQMTGFAGWNFIGASSAVLRDQGGNILLNVFGTTALNAASGIATQINGAVNSFVNNFMKALSPQITKSYACGQWKDMMGLIYQGTRFSYYLLLVLSLPILFNTSYILELWLVEVPDHSAAFVRLILLFSMHETISSPLITAMLATGNIRNYQLIVGGLQLMNLPVAYVLLRLGAVPETVYVVAICISIACFIARIILLRKMIGLDAGDFLIKVYLNIIYVTAASVILPMSFMKLMSESIIPLNVHTHAGALANCALCVLSAVLAIWLAGLKKDEKKRFRAAIRSRLSRNGK